MFDSQVIKQDIEDNLLEALSLVNKLKQTDDIESPSQDYCDGLARGIRAVLDSL